MKKLAPAVLLPYPGVSGLRDVGTSLLILGLSLAGVTVAKADEPVPPPNGPDLIFRPPPPPPGWRPHSLTPEELEIIKERRREREAEYAARPKPPTPPTGIFSGDGVGEQFKSYYRMENAWHEIVNSEDVYVYAGVMTFDPTGGSAVINDPLIGPGVVIIQKGRPGEPTFRGKRLDTPTAVGSLRIIAAEGNILTLQARQGNKFSLNVQTEELTPLGSR